jgi:hypothetical protein
MEDWYKKWHFKINQSKSVHTTFILKLAPCPEVTLFGTQIPPSPNVKYLELTLDHHPTWAHHIKAKKLQLPLTNAQNHNRQQKYSKLNIK